MLACHDSQAYAPSPCHTFVMVSSDPIFQASDHNVTVGVVKTMLFIGTTFSMTHWRIFIQRWSYCLCQDWNRCGPHIFPLLRMWYSQIRKYLAGGMMCAVWLIFPMQDSILSVFIFLNLGMLWCPVPRLSLFIFVQIPAESGFWCNIPYKSFIRKFKVIWVIPFQRSGGM